MLRLLTAALLASTPLMAHALGLGRLVVHSGLDEVLNGQIELISPTAHEIKTLKTTLASREDFDIAGVERAAHLFGIKYSVSQNPNGQYFLKLTTDMPVREPFLHFLIQVEWSGGRLIREYSTLLDPPQWVAGRPAEVDLPAETVVSEAVPVPTPTPVAPEAVESLPPLEATPAPEVPPVGAEVPAEPIKPEVAVGEPAPVAAAPEAAAPSGAIAPVGEPAPVAVQEPVAIPEPAPVMEQPVATVSSRPATAPEYGPVKSGETLGQIAAKLNVDRSITSQQVMLALLRANPSAFFGDNVNNLKVGKILKVPERENMEAIPREQAVKEFRAQYDAWQEYKLKLAGASRAVAVAEEEKPAKPEMKKAEPKKAEKAAKAEKPGKGKPTSAKAEPVDLLRIVRANLERDTGEETTKTPGVETKKEAGKEQAALGERVATLEEAIESKQMQNKEMRERVGKLQEQVKNTERLVELENKELAQAQKKAAEKAAQEKAAAEKAAADKAIAEKAAAEKAMAEKAAADKAAAEKAAQEKAAAAAAKPEPAKPAEAPRPAVPPVAKKPAVIPPPAPPEEGFLESMLAGFADNPLTLALLGAVGVLALGLGGLYAIRRRRAAHEFSESILSSASLSAEGSITSDTSGQAAASDTSFLSDFSQGGMGNIHTDEVDPIAEAEVYLAYGRDEQAEEILKDAIVKDPARQELKGKLLEIYFQRNDVPAFETLAEELYAALEGKGGKVWDKVEEMGRKLSPSNPMFRGGKPVAKAAAPAATTLLVDEAAPGGEESLHSTQGLELGQAQAPTPAATGLDFNLDFEPSAAKPAEPAMSDLGLDFDASALKAEAAPSTTGLDMDFSLEETGGAADTSSNVIDFNLPAASDTGELDFTPPTEGGAGIEFEPVEAGAGTLELEGAPAMDSEGSLPGWDETATKLDLAKAYIDMGDAEGARSILDEVMTEGNEVQKQQARDLAAQIAA